MGCIQASKRVGSKVHAQKAIGTKEIDHEDLIQLVNDFLMTDLKSRNQKEKAINKVRIKHSRRIIQSLEIWTENFLPTIREYKLPEIPEIQVRVTSDLDRNGSDTKEKDVDYYEDIQEFLESSLEKEMRSFRIFNETPKIQEFTIVKKPILKLAPKL
ncbi:unnamed protein product [Moneuplotes crassus]|uniref:Uncharacterized protein n=1 Tax=Euplotes crassus TaxID=5936 RepID=A0AAD1U8U2_EUPCR|nr:unnamed protein product [Moneuplotes crassus]